MPYITHADLAERPGALELAQVASDEHADEVSAELLDAALRGHDTSAWPDEQVQAARRALARIDDAVQDAAALIDGYLAKRGYALPLSPVPSLVQAWCRAIARYLLHKNRRSLDDKDPIVRDWRDAQRLLQQTADGKFSLGADDAVAVHQTDARFANQNGPDQRWGQPGGGRIFSRAELRAWR
ncbi:DUF1320 domain-containing protein [Vandammella animalimorsus]|uniref:gp436 family protein n=1 Tax=Vandammella animalimorsus TaxID=2029117 RepID=UPI0031BAC579